MVGDGSSVWTIGLTLLTIYLLWNGLIYVTYWWDKAQARRGGWRISERSLLLLTICWGGLGAILAAHHHRHKTRKWYFHLAWWVGLLISVGTVYLLVLIF